MKTSRSKRTSPRRAANRVRLVRPVRGMVVDQSPAGFGVSAPQALRVGQRYWFLLRRGLRWRRVEGRVAWCSLVQTQRLDAETVAPWYRAGVAVDVAAGPGWQLPD